MQVWFYHKHALIRSFQVLYIYKFLGLQNLLCVRVHALGSTYVSYLIGTDVLFTNVNLQTCYRNCLCEHCIHIFLVRFLSEKFYRKNILRLNSEDYRWRWTSFFAGASVSFYVYLYAIYYFFLKTKYVSEVRKWKIACFNLL